MGAAVSGDGACYLWGAGTPGTDQTIRCLREAGAGEVVLVELPGEGEGAEPLDVVDVAVGDNHVVILAEGNRCFVAGECHGLGGKQNWLDDWTPLNIGDHSIRSVACGPQSIFLQTS